AAGEPGRAPAGRADAAPAPGARRRAGGRAGQGDRPGEGARGAGEEWRVAEPGPDVGLPRPQRGKSACSPRRTCSPLLPMRPALLLLALAASACGEEDRIFADSSTGYVRFEPPPVDVAAATSKMWMQWVSAPLDHDMDVLDLSGSQSLGGHHA